MKTNSLLIFPQNDSVIYLIKTSILMLILILFSPAYALAPIESLVLGDFSANYSESATDPLNYIYSRDNDIKTTKNFYKFFLAQYRGFYEEGKNLANYCKGRKEIRYASEWDKIQVKRSQMALIQYIGLDLTSRAIPLYAKKLEFTSDEYSNLVEGLVGNYCSTNLSVISKKELLKNLKLKFEKNSQFILPNVNDNPFFPEDFKDSINSQKALENEFLFSVKLFKSLCSWSGNPENAGLMVPILRHPALMAFFQRQMGNLSIGFDLAQNKTFLKNEDQTIQVWCDQLICRKVSKTDFLRKFTPSIGSTSVHDDLKRLYCEDFRNTDYHPKDNDPRLAKEMNSMTFDEENFINSQFIALITGVPDFLLRADNFLKGSDILRANVDYIWSKWAKSSLDNFIRDLFFEEPLTFEVVGQKNLQTLRSSRIRLVFDVNMGEFDRSTEEVGKVKVRFQLNVQNAFLKYYRQALLDAESLNVNEKNRLKNRLKQQIAPELLKAKDKWIIPPWKGDLESLIASEITTQILDRSVKVLSFDAPGNMPIDVEINYGLFALKYIHHQNNVKKNERLKSTP